MLICLKSQVVFFIFECAADLTLSSSSLVSENYAGFALLLIT